MIVGLWVVVVFSLCAARGNTSEIIVKRDLVYGKAGKEELRLSLAMPSSGDGPFPTVVFLHGGAGRQATASK